jgi:RimK family alpha-L-glutamate ligase
MHIAIVAGSLGWHVHDLERATKLLDVQTTFVDITRLSSPNDLLQYDAVLLRTFPSGSLEHTIFRLALLYQAERTGQLVINSPAAFEACVDKYTTTARLQLAGLPVPRTICCQSLDVAMQAYHELGGDVVIKPIFGSEGKGLIRVSDEATAWRSISMLCQLDAVVYLQEFIPHAGYDHRAFVLNGQVIAAMRRSHASDWRTNLARGATAEPIELSEHECQLAIQAAATLKADIAGVDLLHRPDGQAVILEVNGVPGWQGISQATGIDIACKVVQYTVERSCQSTRILR